MGKITVLNMPKNVVFEFAEGRYIWKVTRDGTRNGNYKGSISDCTEIFRTYGDGTVGCEWSGGLFHNPAINDEDGLDCDKCFFIFSYDMDCGSRFKQEKDLVMAPAEITAQITALEPTEEKRK